ncbi:MAG: phosphodiester glycosidase family protein [Pedobacter sp.]|nr:phosphodiester glycosidase family protein [Pedobacter sp.]MDQ8054314.1 phosphodiester glycosidase family protein [Pedobacter sp.]
MKKLFLLLFILAQSLAALAQSDSLAVTNAGWKQTEIAKGVNWKTAQFTQGQLFHANQYITLVEVSKKAKAYRLVLAYSDSLEKTSDISLHKNALAGINGSFFKMRGADPDYNKNLTGVPKLEPAKLDHNRSVVYLRVADSLIAENTFAKDSVRRRHQQGIITIRKGKLAILNTDAKNLYWERNVRANDIIATGPVMLLDGKDQPIPNDAFCNDRHPRTAVGKKKDGTIVLFVVDGRFKEAAGMSIIELQKTMRWLGCIDAINFDGGGSSTMYIQGQPDHGVVNHPSDNKKFDHMGERDVANVLLLVPKNP